MILTHSQFGFIRKRLPSKRLAIITSICAFIMINRVILKPKTSQQTQKLKYILLWTPTDKGPFKYWKKEQEEFKERKCRFTNCFLTRIRQSLDYDLSKFDAILFNGRSLQHAIFSDLPNTRSYHQKYIYLNLESSDNQPICSSVLFDEFFNWTATYKLNSDIKMPLMVIRNRRGDDVGPKINMTWLENMSAFNETLLPTFSKRTKAAAWFVSHCYTRSKREKYARKLKKELKKLNLTLDVYGKCGDVRFRNVERDLLRNTYFFYLAFENSIAEDYVTEKLSIAIRNDVVPIVFGGANYSRFLPPGSYIDARKHEPKVLAFYMAQLIRTPEAYNHFFRWRNHYSYHRPEHVCRLCAALNNQSMVDARSGYREFRRWWNPDYEKRCKHQTWGS